MGKVRVVVAILTVCRASRIIHGREHVMLISGHSMPGWMPLRTAACRAAPEAVSRRVFRDMATRHRPCPGITEKAIRSHDLH